MFTDSINHSAIKENNHEASVSQVLPPELSNNNKLNFKFDTYSFLLNDPPEERAKRFSEDIDKIKKKSISYSNPAFEDLIKTQLSFKLKLFKLTVPLKFRINFDEKIKEIL